MRSKQISKQHRLWLFLSLAAALFLGAVLGLIGLYGSGEESAPPAGPAAGPAVPQQQAVSRRVQLYFVASDGRHLKAEERRLQAGDTISAAEGIITALLQGPRNPRLASAIPPGTRLRHLFIAADGTAYLDFSAELGRHHPGGVTAERLTLYAIVNSLVLNLDDVERVQLLLEGKTPPTLAGHLDLRHARTADLLLIR